MIIVEEVLFLNRFFVRRFHLHILKESLECHTYLYHFCFRVNLLVLLMFVSLQRADQIKAFVSKFGPISTMPSLTLFNYQVNVMNMLSY